ncbi:transcription factor HES-3 [Sorex fumeus]|uniref:transcription factor HES-3 n=1 Tax=Sorex fumeus TaxID=62283 RepID=UPI0024AD3C03|nr:transcription factor HES-3 [Sorex fumeus]
MEKKRRARINRCLEQLRALLEKHYSHQIRKRKLEKADILELSVKYMKSLQSSAQGLWPLPSAADYVSGLRGCPPGGVHPLLPRREEAGGGPRCPLAHGRAGGSTMDSAGARAPARWGPAPAAGGSRAPPARLPGALPGAPAPPPAPVRCSGSPGPGLRVWRPW